MKRSVILGLIMVMLASTLACGPLSSGGRSSSSEIDIKIVNRSPDDVCYVLISASSEDSWGEDRLGSDGVIEPANDRVFSVDNGTYDVQVETCNEEVMATAWELDSDTTINVGESGANIRLVLLNNSNAEICYVRISPSSGDDWGDDRMGAMEQLQPGAARIFYVRADTYDLQAIDCDDNILVEEYNVDLTDDLEWTVGE